MLKLPGLKLPGWIKVTGAGLATSLAVSTVLFIVSPGGKPGDDTVGQTGGSCDCLPGVVPTATQVVATATAAPTATATAAPTATATAAPSATATVTPTATATAAPTATATPAGPGVIDLGSAGDFAILSKSGISTTGATSILADIGVSPIASTAITGFDLTLDASGTFSTSPLVDGKVYAANYAEPTPGYIGGAIQAMMDAYDDAAAAGPPDQVGLGDGDIGGETIFPGIYKWSTGVLIPTDVTLSGGAEDVWIFQISDTLIVSSGVTVNLIGGAQAKNIFWQVAGQTTLGTGAQFQGVILDKTAIVIETGANLTGRAYAQTAVTLDANVVTRPD